MTNMCNTGNLSRNPNVCEYYLYLHLYKDNPKI